jgi:hypothetical protein
MDINHCFCACLADHSICRDCCKGNITSQEIFSRIDCTRHSRACADLGLNGNVAELKEHRIYSQTSARTFASDGLYSHHHRLCIYKGERAIIPNRCRGGVFLSCSSSTPVERSIGYQKDHSQDYDSYSRVVLDERWTPICPLAHIVFRS